MNHDAVALDDPVAASLDGHHAHLARRHGRAATFLPDVATFSSVSSGSAEPVEPDDAVWADLARLLGPGGFADMFSSAATPPADWEPVFVLEGRQMILPGGFRPGRRPGGAEAVEAAVVELGAADVPEMLDLVAVAKPGPFRARTRELGTYLGVRENGALVAMAGERLRPPGWTEVSAVCTAPAARGRGYASLLVGTLVARIKDRGELPFLHVAEANTGAIALYESMGFETRRPVTFRGFVTP